MASILQDQLKQIIDLARKGLHISQRIEYVQDQDREDFHNLVTRVGHLEVEVKSLKDVVSKIPGLTQDKINEAVAPVMQSTETLAVAIDNAKGGSLPIPAGKKKSWWRWWKKE